MSVVVNTVVMLHYLGRGRRSGLGTGRSRKGGDATYTQRYISIPIL